MSEIWRHLKFDFRRHGWLGASSLIILFFAPRFGEWLLVLVVVPFLVMNHKTAGSQTWWLVRPLNRGRLAVAKLLGIVLLCAAAAAVLWVKWMAKGFDPGFVALCQLEVLPVLFAACGLTAVLACLSRDFRRYLLLIPVVLMIAAALVTVWSRLADLVIDWNAGPEVRAWFPLEMRKEADEWLLIFLCAAAGLFAVIWLHYRIRRPVRTAVLTGVAILAPIYFVFVFPPDFKHRGSGISLGESRPFKGHISVGGTEVVAERIPGGTQGGARWKARVPLEIHLEEDFRGHEFFEIRDPVSIAPADESGGNKLLTHSADWWRVNDRPAMIAAAGIAPSNPVDPGRSHKPMLWIRNGVDGGDWFDRSLKVSKAGRTLARQFRTHYVGALNLEAGSSVNDGVNRFAFFDSRKAYPYQPDPGLILSVNGLRPRADSNPAWRYAVRRDQHSLVLWDSRTSEAHFADREVYWTEFKKTGDNRVDVRFSSFGDWNDLPPSRFRELKIFVFRHERIGYLDIEIDPGDLTIRLPEAKSGKGGAGK